MTEKSEKSRNNNWNENPSISIIIPTYNSAKTLVHCLDSIKIQKYNGDIEVIIADGGSTDDTLDIARKYTNKYTKMLLRMVRLVKLLV